MLRKTKYVFLGVFITALGLWGLAVTIPNTFSSGEVVSAAKMNQNFQALKDAVDALEAKAAALEAELAALPERTAMPRAMAIVLASGSTVSAYSITGNAPSSTKTGAGAYTITFPGENLDTTEYPLSLTPIHTGRVCSAVAVISNSVDVSCVDTNGSPADSSFSLILFNK